MKHEIIVVDVANLLGAENRMATTISKEIDAAMVGADPLPMSSTTPWRRVPLKAGATYRTRDGRTVGPLQVNSHGLVSDFPFHCAVPRIGGRAMNQTWTPNGAWLHDRLAHCLDLVEEITRPAEAVASRIAPKDGHSYLTRGGHVVGPMKRDRTGAFPFSGAIHPGIPYDSGLWRDNGAFSYDSRISKYDLVADIELTTEQNRAAPLSAHPTFNGTPGTTPARFRLEAGKRYVTRDGRVTDRIRHKGINSVRPFSGCIDDRIFSWDENGYNGAFTSPIDLVREYIETAAAPAPTLTITAGHRYRLRNGDVVGPLLKQDSHFYPFTAPYADGTESWTPTGRVYAVLPYITVDRDIVSEISEPARLPAIGETWKTRGGRAVKIIAITSHAREPLVAQYDNGGILTRRLDGMHCSGDRWESTGPSPNDITEFVSKARTGAVTPSPSATGTHSEITS